MLQSVPGRCVTAVHSVKERSVQEERKLKKDRRKNMTKSLVRFLQGLCFTVLLSNLMLAQTSTQSANSATDTNNVGDALKKLQQSMEEQQKQIALQQQEIERLRQQVANQQTGTTPQVVDATLHNSTPAS